MQDTSHLEAAEASLGKNGDISVVQGRLKMKSLLTESITPSEELVQQVLLHLWGDVKGVARLVQDDMHWPNPGGFSVRSKSVVDSCPQEDRGNVAEG